MLSFYTGQARKQSTSRRAPSSKSVKKLDFMSPAVKTVYSKKRGQPQHEVSEGRKDTRSITGKYIDNF